MGGWVVGGVGISPRGGVWRGWEGKYTIVYSQKGGGDGEGMGGGKVLGRAGVAVRGEGQNPKCPSSEILRFPKNNGSRNESGCFWELFG